MLLDAMLEVAEDELEGFRKGEKGLGRKKKSLD